MPDTMHWRAMDPRDLRPDEWLVDVNNYAWSCRIDLPPPSDVEHGMMRRYSKQVQDLHTVQGCREFSQRWGGSSTSEDTSGVEGDSRDGPWLRGEEWEKYHDDGGDDDE